MIKPYDSHTAMWGMPDERLEKLRQSGALICNCLVPVSEVIPMFGVRQCGRCKRHLCGAHCL